MQGSISGESHRFLAVLVVATPCPLLIAIPVAILGAISLSARRGIIIKEPAALEKVATCRTAIFDKTGTLTYGEPKLSRIHVSPEFPQDDVLQLAASIERYSKHPLATAIIDAAEARGLVLCEASDVSERPGEGLYGTVRGTHLRITNRKTLLKSHPAMARELPEITAGMECVLLIDGKYAGIMQFRDEIRTGGSSFIDHLRPKHHFQKIMLVSGDRESEVRYLAQEAGITDVHFSQSPEQKLCLVRREALLA